MPALRLTGQTGSSDTGVLTKLASEAVLLSSCLDASCQMTVAGHWQATGQVAVKPQQLHQQQLLVWPHCYKQLALQLAV